MTDELTVEEYQEAICATREKFVPEKQLSYKEWNAIAQALTAVEESEADFGLPKGNHYFLKMTLRNILGVETNKETMKAVARDALDYGYTD